MNDNARVNAAQIVDDRPRRVIRAELFGPPTMFTTPPNCRTRTALATALVALTLLGLGSRPAHAGPAAAGSGAGAGKAGHGGTPVGFQGIELGSFRVRAYHPVEGRKSILYFTLYATVRDEDATECTRLLEHRRHKVRDQVIIATRLVSLGDLNDPELANLRRRILLRLHRMLPELAIEDAYLSHFELRVEAL